MFFSQYSYVLYKFVAGNVILGWGVGLGAEHLRSVHGLTTNRMGNRNTLRDKCSPGWPPDSIADFITDMTLINTVHLRHLLHGTDFDKFNIELITDSYFVLQIDEAVHHDQLVMLEKLYNAFTKVDLAAGNQVINAVYLFRK